MCHIRSSLIALTHTGIPRGVCLTHPPLVCPTSPTIMLTAELGPSMIGGFVAKNTWTESAESVVTPLITVFSLNVTPIAIFYWNVNNIEDSALLYCVGLSCLKVFFFVCFKAMLISFQALQQNMMVFQHCSLSRVVFCFFYTFWLAIWICTAANIWLNSLLLK